MAPCKGSGVWSGIENHYFRVEKYHPVAVLLCSVCGWLAGLVFKSSG